MKTSLLISTYNWPRALELCLAGVLRQRKMPDEILIADDGSGDETRRVIADFAARCTVPVRHLWQEDDGFRKTAICNKAFAAATGDYIIQTDGDCIPHRDFVADHLRFARPGCYVGGSRAHLGKPLTERILSGKIPPPANWLTTGIEDHFNALRFPWLAPLFIGYKPDNVRGCNFSCWREDLVAVNGYDETYTAWGGEDSELSYRLRNLGRRKRAMKFAGFVYHLYHPEASRDTYYAVNRSRSLLSLKEHKIRCEKGLDQYLRTDGGRQCYEIVK